MTSAVTNRQSLLDLATATLEALHNDPASLHFSLLRPLSSWRLRSHRAFLNHSLIINSPTGADGWAFPISAMWLPTFHLRRSESGDCGLCGASEGAGNFWTSASDGRMQWVFSDYF